MKYSVIVPVYNRPDEVAELLDSLAARDGGDIEVVIVEDGSTVPCRGQADAARARGLDVRYFAKPNEGRSIARNYGMERATGDWFVFFDSDCVIPAGYFARLDKALADAPHLDCYGGPDAAHDSFSDTQKAINYTMTAFLTTGGIRGGRVRLERFVPRTFNMGFSRRVYGRVGGFREMFSEDIDMSTRIRLAGFSTGYIDNPVWHKRRVDLAKFWRQVHIFGMSRITLRLLYPDSLKPVHALPAVALVAAVVLLALGCTLSPWYLLPLGLYALGIFAGALAATRSLRIALLAVPAAAIQICGYGSGFIKAWFTKILLGRGRDVEEEILLRKGR